MSGVRMEVLVSLDKKGKNPSHSWKV